MGSPRKGISLQELDARYIMITQAIQLLAEDTALDPYTVGQQVVRRLGKGKGGKV